MLPGDGPIETAYVGHVVHPSESGRHLIHLVLAVGRPSGSWCCSFRHRAAGKVPMAQMQLPIVPFSSRVSHLSPL